MWSSNNLKTKNMSLYAWLCLDYASSIQTTYYFRSSDKHLLVVPSTKLVQSRLSFLHAAPTVWNSLPLALRSTSSYSLFHSLLKTHFFLHSLPSPSIDSFIIGPAPF